MGDTAEVIRRQLSITRRVQGVFFRDSCRREAERLGVSGWARNLDDGRVDVVAEGAPDQVEALTLWCRTGPDQAVVDHVEVRDEEPEGLTGFSVG